MPKLHTIYKGVKAGAPPTKERKRGTKPKSKAIAAQPIKGKNRKSSTSGYWGSV